MSLSWTKFDHNTLEKILLSYPFYPHSTYQKIEQSLLKDNFRESCMDKISRSSSVYYLSEYPSGCKGIVWTALQNFDTQIFGWKTEILEALIAQGDYNISYNIKRALMGNILKDCVNRGVSYLGHRTSSQDLSTIHALEKSGFIMIDGLMTLSLDLRNRVPPKRNTPFVFRQNREKDLTELKRISKESFLYDRFHSEPMIAKSKADKLHEDWIENSCRGLVDAVMVAEEEGTVVGYMTCKIDRSLKEKTNLTFGSVVLVATASEKRSKGIASDLLNYTLGWFYSNNVDFVEVGTQIRNIPACRLYEKAGFRLRETSLFFRKWLNKT